MNRRPEINMSRIAVGGGVGGAIFAIGCMCLFLVGLPAARLLLIAALPLGLIIAVCLFLVHKYRPVQLIEVLPPDNKTNESERPGIK